MIWFFLILLVLGFAAPFVLERLKPKMIDEATALAPGRFAALPSGETHYQWRGPENGPVLVCIHGLTTPSYVWDWIAPSLAEAGFRVLTYDLYGRGFSGRPKGRQTGAFFARQLQELLRDQGVGDGVMLLGYSMGGSIATVYAAENPGQVHRVLLLAPAGMEHTPGRLAEFARKTPLLGDWLMLALGGRKLCRNMRAAAGPPDLITELAERQAIEVGFAGYLPGVLSSQRGLLAKPLEKEHRQLAEQDVPLAAIWGEADTVIPISALGRLTEWNRSATQIVIPGADHGLAYTHSAEVLEAIAEAMGS